MDLGYRFLTEEEMEERGWFWIGGGGLRQKMREYETQQPTHKPDNENQIPYHSVYFGCCGRTIMTREDIAQPEFCTFCGKHLDK